MTNLKSGNGMDNNIELFDRYIEDKLSERERRDFDRRLQDDMGFATDFRIYLFTLQGICREAEQENVEFGHAMKKISEEDLRRIIGRASKETPLRRKPLRERWAWVASVAAILVAGIFSVISVHRSAMDNLDDVIVAYNYIPDSDRGSDYSTSVDGLVDIAALEEAYQKAPTDDIQAREDTGMRLAMAYLKAHDRKKAVEILTDLSVRFADDEEFAAQCKKILNQLKQ